ncbi:MAG: hypothetical protein QXT34_01120 [Candidatus Aenigmatarchaeota archaeon]
MKRETYLIEIPKQIVSRVLEINEDKVAEAYISENSVIVKLSDGETKKINDKFNLIEDELNNLLSNYLEKLKRIGIIDTNFLEAIKSENLLDKFKRISEILSISISAAMLRKLKSYIDLDYIEEYFTREGFHGLNFITQQLNSNNHENLKSVYIDIINYK